MVREYMKKGVKIEKLSQATYRSNLAHTTLHRRLTTRGTEDTNKY